jgi:hypothetical protein
MFIYKIEVNNQIYIGLDTKEPYKQSRWKAHCRDSKKSCKQSVHKAIKESGIENAKYTVIAENFTSIVELAKAEIKYIKEYDSFRNGLNETLGGDGLGVYFPNLTENEIFELRKVFSDTMRNYNTHIKWANTSLVERQDLTSHLHTPEIYKKRSITLKETYRQNADLAKSKSAGIVEWQKNNKEHLCKQNKINGAKGAAKVSKKIKIVNPEGIEKIYNSKSEFAREHGFILKSILNKTLNGLDHNGWKGWEI